MGPQQQLHWGPKKTPQGHLPWGTNGCTRFWLSSHCRCRDTTSGDPPSSYFQEGAGFPHVSTNSISFLFPHLFFARSSHKSTLKDGKSNRKMGKACKRNSLKDVRRVPQGFALCSLLFQDVPCIWLQLENQDLAVLVRVWGKVAGSCLSRGCGVRVAPREMCVCPHPQDHE